MFVTMLESKGYGIITTKMDSIERDFSKSVRRNEWLYKLVVKKLPRSDHFCCSGVIIHMMVGFRRMWLKESK